MLSLAFLSTRQLRSKLHAISLSPLCVRRKVDFIGKREVTPVVWDNIHKHLDSVAIVDGPTTYTYRDVIRDSLSLRASILSYVKPGDCVGMLMGRDYTYVVSQWAIWHSGGVAVPLSLSGTPSDWHDSLKDSACKGVVVVGDTPRVKGWMDDVRGSEFQAQWFRNPEDWRREIERKREGERERSDDELLEELRNIPEMQSGGKDGIQRGDALILYTSGTTSKPKGVVHTHTSLRSQVQTLQTAWGWTPADVTPLCLPLHHVHGLVNVVLCALATGAVLTFPSTPSQHPSRSTPSKHPSRSTPLEEPGTVHPVLATKGVDAVKGVDGMEGVCRIWEKFGLGVGGGVVGPVTWFSAVPTVYGRLLEAWDAATEAERERVRREVLPFVRVWICGSAALPQPLLEAWRSATGTTLLERYGMTEIGMALSNPLHERTFSSEDERSSRQHSDTGTVSYVRTAGAVGWPLPGVRCGVLVDEDEHSRPEGENAEEVVGELVIQSPTLFRTYLNRPDATRDAFLHAEPETLRTFDAADNRHSLRAHTAISTAEQNSAPSEQNSTPPTQTSPVASEHPSGEKGVSIGVDSSHERGGWFCTGDIVARSNASGQYRILGRASADILKCRGYKISALEIERVVLAHPEISEAVVVAGRDEAHLEDGDVITVVAKVKAELPLGELQAFCRKELADYKLPRKLILAGESGIPRNALGKVNKRQLEKMIAAGSWP